MEKKDCLELLEYREQQDLQVVWDNKDFVERLVTLDKQVLLVNEVLQVVQVRQDKKDKEDCQEVKECEDQMVQLGLKDSKVNLEGKELLVRLDL